MHLWKRLDGNGDHITVSIFVNPTQFGEGEDLENYPRDLERDVQALNMMPGVDVVFIPTVDALYPDGTSGQRLWIDCGGMDTHLCGRYRPGHFRGVATVVAKLFLCCRPHAAIFGLKDAQQFFILQRLSRDLLFGVQIIGVDTVRAPDGLALSSRNMYLTPEQRAEAVVLSRAVQQACRMIEEGEQQVSRVVATMRQELARASTGQGTVRRSRGYQRAAAAGTHRRWRAGVSGRSRLFWQCPPD